MQKYMLVAVHVVNDPTEILRKYTFSYTDEYLQVREHFRETGIWFDTVDEALGQSNAFICQRNRELGFL